MKNGIHVFIDGRFGGQRANDAACEGGFGGGDASDYSGGGGGGGFIGGLVAFTVVNVNEIIANRLYGALSYNSSAITHQTNNSKTPVSVLNKDVIKYMSLLLLP